MILGKPLCYAYLIIMQKHNGVETILFNHSAKNTFRAIAKGTLTKYESNSSKSTEINHCAKETKFATKAMVNFKKPEVAGVDSIRLIMYNRIRINYS